MTYYHVIIQHGPPAHFNVVCLMCFCVFNLTITINLLNLYNSSHLNWSQNHDLPLTHTSLLSTLNVHPLQHCRNKLKLTLLFKYHNTSCNLFSSTYSNLSLRNYSPYNYLVPFCRTSVYLIFFFPFIIKSWNSLPHTIKQSKSLSLLKYYIDSNL